MSISDAINTQTRMVDGRSYAIELPRETQMPDRIAESSQRAYARFAGLMFFVVLIFDIAGLLIVSSVRGNGSFVEISQPIMASETLYRIGLCCGLVGSLSTIPLAIALYAAVKPVDGTLAMMALVFRVAEAATGAPRRLALER